MLQEAMNFFGSIFRDSKGLRITRYGKEGPGPERTVITTKFLLEGNEVVFITGCPQCVFSQVLSLVGNCPRQRRSRLVLGHTLKLRRWLKDKYGVSWQVVPVVLAEMLNDAGPKNHNGS